MLWSSNRFSFRWVGSKIYRRYFWHIYRSFGNRSDFMPKTFALVIYLCRLSLFRHSTENSSPHFCFAESLFMDFHFLSDCFGFLPHHCLFCFPALSAVVFLSCYYPQFQNIIHWILTLALSQRRALYIAPVTLKSCFANFSIFTRCSKPGHVPWSWQK